MMVSKTLNKPLAAVLALLMAVCAFAFVAADSSDAASFTIDGENIEAHDFKENHTGTLVVNIVGTIADKAGTLVVKEGSREIVSQSFTTATDKTTVDVRFELSEGSHNLQLYATIGGETSSASVTVNSSDNIWSHATSYIILVIVVIVVVIIAVVYMRAKPNNKPTTTFTQLEAEKKAAATEKPAASSKTEKVKYTSSRRK